MFKKNEEPVALINCFICGDGAQILLHSRLGDLSKLNHTTMPGVYCERCSKALKDGGIALIEIDKSKSKIGSNDLIKPEDAYRTGKIAMIKKESVEKTLGIKVHTDILYVEEGFLESLGITFEKPVKH